MKKSLFHFTDAQAVHSILLNKSIWLTDLRFLNDSRELYDGVDIFNKSLDNPQHGIFSNYDYKKESTDYLKKAFADGVSFGINEEPIFVFSMSRMGNILSQWRAYGIYAIEFDERMLRDELSILRDCIYSLKDKEDLARNAVAGALAEISQEMGQNDGCIGMKSLDELSNIMEVAATFKDQGFSEEREVRIIKQAPEQDESIKYRPKNNKLIPYYEMKISLDCIKAIHVGPMAEQELAFSSMSSFVRKIERNWQIDSSNIEYALEVEKSSIPYRGSV